MTQEDWDRHEQANRRGVNRAFGVEGMRNIIADMIRPGVEEAIRQHARGASHVKVTLVDGEVVDVEAMWGLLESD